MELNFVRKDNSGNDTQAAILAIMTTRYYILLFFLNYLFIQGDGGVQMTNVFNFPTDVNKLG